MKEIADILDAWRRFPQAVLATVVRVEGSAYRRPGARMLILPEGQTIGSVSGGCIERDVVFRAGAIAAGGGAVVVRYDSVSEEEGGPSAAVGCGGTVDVMIESAGEALKPLQWLWSRRQHGIMATVIAHQNAGVEIGWRVARDQTNHLFSTSEPADIDWASLLDEQPAVSCQLRHTVAGGWIDLFIEVIEPPLELFIFGSGADAVPLASLGRSLGWRVSVVDLRSNPHAVGRTFDADALVHEIDEVQLHAGAAAVVMNHNWNHDLASLRRLASARLKYLGVLGPRRRTERLLKRLGNAGPPRQQMYYPVGLDIGAETPQEVALAIVAEITSVLRGGNGGSLREKSGPIHTSGEMPCPLAGL